MLKAIKVHECYLFVKLIEHCLSLFILLKFRLNVVSSSMLLLFKKSLQLVVSFQSMFLIPVSQRLNEPTYAGKSNEEPLYMLYDDTHRQQCSSRGWWWKLSFMLFLPFNKNYMHALTISFFCLNAFDFSSVSQLHEF